MGIYIIAEAGVNHNGCLEKALELCRIAKDCGADAVKFQTWKTENIVTPDTGLAGYQADNLQDGNKSQYDMLKELELPYRDFIRIKEYCDAIRIQFLSTPDDEESLDFLMQLNLPVVKIGSGEITNIPYLRKIGNKKKPVILSTGMSDLGEVEKAYYTLKEAGALAVTLLHCTTNYPCPMNEVNLKAMLTLREAFQCEVGYSDHTAGIEVAVAAAALGACVIEKHFTSDKSQYGPDHKASLSPAELSNMIRAVRNIEKALGSGLKIPNTSERNIADAVQKRIITKVSIRQGEIFSENNLTVKRSNAGEKAGFWDYFIGRKALRDYQAQEPVSFQSQDI